MILHASVTVAEPRDAAKSLAQLMGGEAFPFPHLADDAWVALAGDDHGTLVEFLQRGTEFHYAPGRTVAHRQGERTRESGFHILIETPFAEDRVLAIAEERGCRAHRAWHGPAEVIEFWIEDCLLVEVVTPQMATAYKGLATLANVRSMVSRETNP